jgi:hypothetical protein
MFGSGLPSQSENRSAERVQIFLAQEAWYPAVELTLAGLCMVKAGTRADAPFPAPFARASSTFLRYAPDRFLLTIVNTCSTIERPASLRSNNVRLRRCLVRSLRNQRSPSVESSANVSLSKLWLEVRRKLDPIGGEVDHLHFAPAPPVGQGLPSLEANLLGSSVHFPIHILIELDSLCVILLRVSKRSRCTPSRAGTRRMAWVETRSCMCRATGSISSHGLAFAAPLQPWFMLAERLG